MRYINYLGQDAYDNIAMDSWLLDNLKPTEPVFALWQNKRAVIVGQNQNTFGEINQDYIDKNHVQVVRRVSGGGAVYHDLGNICFTFLFQSKRVVPLILNSLFNQCMRLYIHWGLMPKSRGVMI